MHAIRVISVIAIATITTISLQGFVEELPTSVKAAKKKFETNCTELKAAYLKKMDELISEIEKSQQIGDLDRQEILDEMREARTQLVNGQELPVVGPLAKAALNYIDKLRSAYTAFEQDLRKESAYLKGENLSATNRTLKEARDYVTQFDALQLNSKWTGVRNDSPIAPMTLLRPNCLLPKRPQDLKKPRNTPPQSARGIVRVIERGGVPANCSRHAWTIKKRTGNQILVEVNQNNGAAIWEMEGTFNGIVLDISTTKMLKGSPRQFRYRGYAMGKYLEVEQIGIKVDGKPARGFIYLMAN